MSKGYYYCLYRAYDKEDKLLYVGFSVSMLNRVLRHKNSSSWFRDAAKITMEQFETKELVLAAERAAIKTEAPMHNITGSLKKGRMSDAQLMRELFRVR